VLSLQDTVLLVLEEHPETRGDNFWLIIHVLRKLGINIYVDYKQKPEIPAFESITRCRRKIQEEGLYLPNKEVLEMRGQAAEEMRQINKWYPE